VLDALTKTGAKAGTYQVDVKQLAQAQQLTSKAQSSQTAAIGTGASTTIRIELGTASGNSYAPRTSTTITVDATNNSLDGIAKAFKAAGVDATVVKNGSGFSLQLNGQTGAANSLRVSVGGDSALQKLLGYSPSASSGLTQNVAAQDAKLTVDGKAVTSASNVVTGAIDGTALSLKTIGASSVTVGQDSGAIAKNVANFASAYNSLVGKLNTLRNGDLKSDAAIGQVQDQLSQLIKGNPGLVKAGVTVGTDGLVKVDSKALDAAVAADPAATAELFTDSSGKGVADQLASKIGQFIGSTGLVGSAKQAVQQDTNTLTTQQTALTKALTARANALVAQYSSAVNGTQSTDLSSVLPGYTGPTSLFDLI
jgi:flagellar hook-associated protein 2